MKRRRALAALFISLWVLLPGVALVRIVRGQDAQGVQGGEASDADKVAGLFEAAIDAMGGQAYLDVKDITSEGQSFFFNNRGESSGLVKFTDYTKLPDKSRFELGNKKKDREVTVFNLEKEEGWILDGDDEARAATPDEMKDFHAAADHSIDNIFHFRWKDPRNRLFYLGPGKGADAAYDVVQLLDPSNDEVVVYFDRATKLPAKIESWRVNERGVKVRDADEYSQWHRLQGVLTPKRIDSYTNGHRRAQQFFLKVAYNSGIKDDFFSKPVYKKK